MEASIERLKCPSESFKGVNKKYKPVNKLTINKNIFKDEIDILSYIGYIYVGIL